ncbi:hypothetical protein C5C66_09245 [Rathayibacter toxicus]|uniref:DUF4177 domain-containing protein n=2 Tax=Rathayibacter toxicus TaxID=145458 RepID=A0A0C5BII0_9MICO|nr:hypothetical protein TI83_09385 [Rathayibacter toxicus]ALS57661.1 hypothetical protein APU90_07680 [Rathayibacter toxicus]KKM45007.1 hypothetical protein VT73_07845 [Rathayibacter toxicus]PPG20667.1 hypothetical protein C5D15_09240 [Rathayibacter toxicus]PPG45771.1 hypothetical protein C5D16_09205 [Rathayibacter toxicus]
MLRHRIGIVAALGREAVLIPFGEVNAQCAEHGPAPAPHVRRAMSVPRWEYVTTPLMIHNTTAILNTWGSEGWELVQIVIGPEGGLVAYLKRPIVEADA